MSQNQEIIEAKLCAYIDDELDAAGRADLEKHLTANPQHQRLIEELRRTSSLVRNLPRDSAPSELAEGFGAQLERSVLLEGVSEDVAAADLKAPRWPQLVAMAAITLLTVGLAVVVYFALPGTGGRPQIVESLPHSMTPMPAAGEDDRLADAKTRDFDKTLNSELEKTNKEKPAAPASLSSGGMGSVVASAAPKASPMMARVAAVRPPEEFRAKAAGLKDAAADASSPVVLVMHSNDPGEARRSLVIYLVQQNIAWEPAQVPADTSLARGDVGDAAHAVGGAFGPQQVAMAADPAAKQLQLDGSRERQLAAATAPTTVPSSPSSTETGSLAPEQTNHPVAAEPAPTTPSVLDAAKRSELPRGGGGGAAVNPDFAISCRITPEQAEALRASLAQPGISFDALPAELEQKLVSAERKVPDVSEHASTPAPSALTPVAAVAPTTNPSADAIPATSPAPGAVAPDELRKLSNERFATVGAPAADAPAAPTTQPTSGQLPMVEFVIVVRAADQPSTQPATPAAPIAPIAPAAPTTEPAAQDAPAAPTTEPQ